MRGGNWRASATFRGGRVCESLAQIIGGVLLVCVSHEALAQSVAGDNSGSAPEQLSTVVVTAERVKEDAQVVPMSLQALDEKALQETGIKDIHDVALRTPGVDITNGVGQPGNSVITIRGIAPIGGLPTTGLYIDDVPVTGGIGGTSFSSSPEPLVNDTARVEVLKGPQGTLYGDSSMGGAIKFVSNRPDASAFSGHADVETSAVDHGGIGGSASATLNAPLVADKLALRTSVSYRDDPGYLDNVSPVTREVNATDVNSYRTVAARIALAYMPDDTLTITPAVLYQRGSTSDRSYATATVEGSPQPSYFSTAFLLPYEKETYQPEPSTDRVTLATLNIEKKFGDVTLTSISGYFWRLQDEVTDLTAFVDGILQGNSTLYPAVQNILTTNHTDTGSINWSQELRLASSQTARLHWTLGAFFGNQNSHSSEPVVADGLTSNLAALYGAGTTLQTYVPYALPNDYLFNGSQHSVQRQYAGYGTVGYNITSKVDLTVGARYFSLRQESNSGYDGFFNGGPSAQHQGPVTFTGLDPRYVLDYKVTSENFLYASASRGYRAGLINGVVPTNVCAADLHNLGLTSAPAAANPDSLWNYEVGSKNQWFDNRLRVNVAVYQMNWTDIQLDVNLPTCDFSFEGNAGKARVRGAELELEAQVVEGLVVGGFANYVDARITDVPPGDVTPFRVGDQLPYAPMHTYSAYGEYSRPLLNSARAFIRVDYTRHGQGVRDASVNSFEPNYIQAPWDVANVNIGADFGRWKARFFVRNVFDKYGPLDMQNIWGQWRVAPIIPRTIGVNLAAQF